MRYIYFIYYENTFNSKGSTEFDSSRKITSIEQIRNIEKALSYQFKTNLTVSNWKLLRKEKE